MDFEKEYNDLLSRYNQVLDANKIITEQSIEMKQELDKFRAGTKIRRPLAMPVDITIQEFNWMVTYLKERRKEILNHKADIPKEIKPKLEKV